MKISKIMAALLAICLSVNCVACGSDTGNTDMSKIEESYALESEEQPEDYEEDAETVANTETEASTEEVEAQELNHLYTTQFATVNEISYPLFMFDYPDNWSVLQENVTEDEETVVLENERGVTITFSYTGNVPEGTFETGGSSTVMSRVEVSKVSDSCFTPTYVQGSEYYDLGAFMVAKLKYTGQLDMTVDSDFEDIDGYLYYAVLPESEIGINDGVRHPYDEAFAFWYSGYISFIASAPDGQFTEQEEQDVISILSSFRAEY